MTISKLNGVAWASIAKANGVAVAAISSINGQTKPASATRLYLQNAAAPYNPATERGAWDIVSLYDPIKLATTKSGVAATNGVSETNATANWDILVLKGVTDGLPGNVSISGTFSFVIGAVESSTSADANFHFHIFVTVADSDVVRGTLLSNEIVIDEFPTTAAGHGASGIALGTVAAQTGDRIVVEIGVRFANSITSVMGATLNYGNTGSTDLTDGSTNVTTEPGWVEFSVALGL